jgi:hypothetical protein
LLAKLLRPLVLKLLLWALPKVGAYVLARLGGLLRRAQARRR